MSEDDDGFSTLSPDLYMKFRITQALHKHGLTTVTLAEFLFKSRFLAGAYTRSRWSST